MSSSKEQKIHRPDAVTSAVACRGAGGLVKTRNNLKCQPARPGSLNKAATSAARACASRETQLAGWSVTAARPVTDEKQSSWPPRILVVGAANGEIKKRTTHVEAADGVFRDSGDQAFLVPGLCTRRVRWMTGPLVRAISSVESVVWSSL
jgi:hypothetical protein